jgi:hypothetical protein
MVSVSVPQRPMFTGLVHSSWHFWEVVEPLEDGALWEVQSLRNTPEEILGCGPLPVFPFHFSGTTSRNSFLFHMLGP